MWRRWLVVAAMLALAVVAGVMLYLSVQANRSRADAEHSAGVASDAAKLAEDRLTQGLIAQGRRELNDGRAQPALAYFAEALRRGGDSIAVRTMISIAARGWRWERRIVRPATFSAMAQTDAHLVVGDQQGKLSWFTLEGEPAGELPTDFGDIVQLKPMGERLLIAGAQQIGLVDADHKIVWHWKPRSTAYMAMPGPGADEVIAAEHEAFVIYDHAGKERRRIALEPQESGWQPVFEPHGRFVLVGGQGMLSLIDLVTMTRRTLDKEGIDFPAVAANGSQLAYLDNDRDIHFLGPDGRDTRKLHGRNDPVGIAFTPDALGYWLLEPDGWSSSFSNPPDPSPSGTAAAIVSIANSQVNSDPDRGYFCNPYGPCEAWCALFATWVWQQAGIPIPSYPFTGNIYDWAAAHGQVLPPTARPLPGDAVLYGTGPSSASTSLHVGLVVQTWPDGAIVTVEGDAGPAPTGSLAVIINGPYLPSRSAIYNGMPIYAFAQP